MIDSILDSIKKLIGLTADDTSFDVDLIMHINSIFMVLNQLGIGPDAGFSIAGKTEKWSDYVLPSANTEALKSYMYLRVKMLFDPANTSYTQEAFEKIVREFEWRLIHQKEIGQPPPPP